jgi:predicted DNA-binding transcriptional regulator YafY
MPVNKNAYRRYQLIDAILLKGGYPSLEKILFYLKYKGCSVSAGTLENDLKAMRSHFKCSIEYSRSNMGYFYSDPEASFDIPVSDEDVETIWMAIDKLKEFRYSKAFQNVNKMLERLRSRLEIDLDENRKNADRIIFYEPEPDFAGSEWLSVIYDAIRECKRVSFMFHYFAEKKEHLIDPYALKEYAGRWYVIGQENSEQVYYGLDRINGLVTLESFFLKDEKVAEIIRKDILYNYGKMNFVDHKHRVKIRYDASLAEEIKRNLISDHNRIIEKDSTDIVITVKDIVDEDFVRKYVLPYGDKATVIGPNFAIDLVIGILTQMMYLHKAAY